jgi:methylated-DNA-[protein]-cysteine S-methyltransferase
MKHTAAFESPVGTVMISEEDNAITEVTFSDTAENEYCSDDIPLLKRAVRELKEYFQGERMSFDLPIHENGTVFQKKVWKQLRTIPYGETRSYGEVAESIGNPKAARAVGMANNRNPIAILTPCHRVIGSDGKLVGYACGIERKEQLLQLEKKYA